jgi:hypothetical protein
MKAIRYTGRVLADGHLTLPPEAAQTGREYEVILLPSPADDILAYSHALAEAKGCARYTDEDIERIVHAVRAAQP